MHPLISSKQKRAGKSASAVPTAAPAHQIKTHPLVRAIAHPAAAADIRESAILALKRRTYIEKSIQLYPPTIG